jgi:hypothetical protein
LWHALGLTAFEPELGSGERPLLADDSRAHP